MVKNCSPARLARVAYETLEVRVALNRSGNLPKHRRQVLVSAENKDRSLSITPSGITEDLVYSLEERLLSASKLALNDEDISTSAAAR